MLKQRILTGITLLAVASIVFCLGGFALRVLVFALYVVGAYEFVRLQKSFTHDESMWFAGLLSTIPLSYWSWGFSGVAGSALSLALVILSTQVLRTEREHHQGFPVDAISHLFLGLGYVGIFGTALFVIVGEFPRSELFWLLLMVIAADTGAFFGGRAIGGPKLAPRISPNKTCSGALCGIGASILASLVGAHFLGLSQGWGGGTILFGILSGVLVSVLSIVGDLTESLFKRAYDVKDSGTIFPGHGGVLDRIDGLLLAAPALYILGGGWW